MIPRLALGRLTSTCSSSRVQIVQTLLLNGTVTLVLCGLLSFVSLSSSVHLFHFILFSKFHFTSEHLGTSEHRSFDPIFGFFLSKPKPKPHFRISKSIKERLLLQHSYCKEKKISQITFHVAHSTVRECGYLYTVSVHGEMAATFLLAVIINVSVAPLQY